MYWITGEGLKPIASQHINLSIGGYYPMGACQSPDYIFITRIEHNRIFYKHIPLTKGQRELTMEKHIAQSLIETGCENRCKQLRQFVSSRNNSDFNWGDTEWAEKEILRLESILAGQPGYHPPVEDLVSLRVTMYVENYDGDGWNLIDELTGLCCSSARSTERGEEYEANFTGMEAYKELTANPHINITGLKIREEN